MSAAMVVLSVWFANVIRGGIDFGVDDIYLIYINQFYVGLRFAAVAGVVQSLAVRSETVGAEQPA